MAAPLEHKISILPVVVVALVLQVRLEPMRKMEMEAQAVQVFRQVLLVLLSLVLAEAADLQVSSRRVLVALVEMEAAVPEQITEAMVLLERIILVEAAVVVYLITMLSIEAAVQAVLEL